MYPHRIRLNGPWEVEPIARLVREADGMTQVVEGPVPAARRMTMPCRWDEGGLGDFAGRVRFRRRFGYPGRIDAYERVWLTFDAIAGFCEISLNGQALGHRAEGDGGFEFEITKLLKERNELILEIDAPAGRGGLTGEAALEIRCTAFLRHIQARGSFVGNVPTIEVTGQVVGSSEGPLELYVLVNGATEHYTLVQASAKGKPFHVAIRTNRRSEPHVVRVDLVQGAMLWYAVERAVTPAKEAST
jgi:hypothetical protein